MMIKRKQLILILVLAVAALLPCALAQVGDPAADATQEQALNADLIKAGPDSVKQICDLIVPPGTGDDTKARYAIGSLTNYASRPGAASEQKMVAGVLAKALTQAENKEVKFFFINQLQFVGSDQTVPVLSEYLDDERLCDAASSTLLVIGSKASGDAFFKAFLSGSQKNLPMIVHALGQLQSKAAAGPIGKHATSQDAIIRRVSLKALGNIGDASSIKILRKATRVDDPYERSIATASYLRLAVRLNEQGKNKQGVRICRQIIEGDYPAAQGNTPCAALSVLTDALGKEAITDLLKAVDHENPQVQAAALALASKIEGAQATGKWVSKLKAVSPERQIKIIDMLGDRGDKAALPALRASLGQNNKEVRLSALQAVVQLDGAAAIPDLMNVLKNAQGDDIGAISSLLLQLPTKPVISALLKSLPQVSSEKQVVLVDMLAERRSSMAVDAIMSLTGSSETSVHMAATKALGKTAGQGDLPRIITLMLNAKSARQQAEAGRAIVAVCLKNDKVQNRAAPLLSAYGSATAAQKIAILKLLPAIGGSKAFQAVLVDTRSDDSKIRDAAVRGLAQWKDAEALDAQFKMASDTTELNYHVMNLKGYIDLVAGPGVRAQDKVAHLTKALSIARRADEKKQAISKLALIRAEPALAVVSPFLDDKVLGPEASLAVMKIVFGDRRDQPLAGGDVISSLQALIKTDPKSDIKTKVENYLAVLLMERASWNQPPPGFVALFNGKDLTGWKGLLASPNDNPIKRGRLSSEALAAEQAKADAKMRKHWTVNDGILKFDGGGYSLATIKDYEDFEMWVDWKVLYPRGDSGLYLRGTPQVQIWDPGQWKIGSGGLYNNQKNPSQPTSIADNPIGQWNTFYIKMIGDRVTVRLNDTLVVDNVILENYWDRKQPIFPSEQIELQCHGNPIDFRNIYIREIPREEGFVSLFNGKDLTGWVGDTKGYIVQDSTIVCKPGGNLYTEKEYSDFVFKFEFKLTPGANNGLGIRAPLTGDAAYKAMELQILDDTADKYKNLKPYQYHGSIYGVVPVIRGHQTPVGQWNTQKVIAKGNHIKVILNGKTVVDADIKKASENGTMDGREHPGLLNEKGHIGFLGHGSVVEFRNIEIRE